MEKLWKFVLKKIILFLNFRFANPTNFLGRRLVLIWVDIIPQLTCRTHMTSYFFVSFDKNWYTSICLVSSNSCRFSQRQFKNISQILFPNIYRDHWCNSPSLSPCIYVYIYVYNFLRSAMSAVCFSFERSRSMLIKKFWKIYLHCSKTKETREIESQSCYRKLREL